MSRRRRPPFDLEDGYTRRDLPVIEAEMNRIHGAMIEAGKVCGVGLPGRKDGAMIIEKIENRIRGGASSGREIEALVGNFVFGELYRQSRRKSHTAMHNHSCGELDLSREVRVYWWTNDCDLSWSTSRPEYWPLDSESNFLISVVPLSGEPGIGGEGACDAYERGLSEIENAEIDGTDTWGEYP